MKERIRSLYENRIFALIIWLIAISTSLLLMQNTATIIHQKGQPQLANNSQPVIAQNMQKNWGRNIGDTYNVNVVFKKNIGKIGSTEQTTINNAISKLKGQQRLYGIKTIKTLTTNHNDNNQFLSADKSTEIVQLSIDKNNGHILNVANQIQNNLNNIPGMNCYVTSPEIVNDVLTQKINQVTYVATLILFILALVIMGILLKSIIAPIISTLTILISYVVSLSVANNLTVHLHLSYSEYTPLMIMLTTILLGLLSQFVLLRHFSQQLNDGKVANSATKDSIHNVRSLLFVIGLTLSIIFAGFALFQLSTLRAIAILVVPVILTILSTLTIVPVFMKFLGEHFFWPSVSIKHNHYNLWNSMARFGLWRPVVAIISVLVLVGTFTYNYHQNLNFNSSTTLDSSQQSLIGMHVLNTHFTPGKATPVTIYVKSNDRLDNEKSLLQLDNLTTKIQSLKGVSSVTSATQPNGQPIIENYVNNQLNNITSTLKGTTNHLKELINSIKKDSSNLDRIRLALNSDKIDQLVSRSLNMKDFNKTIHSQVNEMAGNVNISQRKRASKLVRQYQQLLNLINMQLQNVSNNMRYLSNELSQNQTDASYVRSNNSRYTTQIKNIQIDLKKTTKNLSSLVNSYNNVYKYLLVFQSSNAAKIYYLTPKQLTNSQFQQSLMNHTSEDYKTTILQVTLKDDSNATNTAATIQNLKNEVTTQLQGTTLKNTQVAYTGQPVIESTIQSSMMSQAILIFILIIGIFFIILTLVSRSMIQPIFWVLTFILSILVATKLTQILTTFLGGETTFNWQVPLIALPPVLIIGVVQLMQVAIKYRYNELPLIDWILPGITEMGQTLHYLLFIFLTVGLGLLFTGYNTIMTTGWIFIFTVLIFNFILPIIIAAIGKLTITLPQHKLNSKHHLK